LDSVKSIILSPSVSKSWFCAYGSPDIASSGASTCTYQVAPLSKPVIISATKLLTLNFLAVPSLPTSLITVRVPTPTKTLKFTTSAVTYIGAPS